MVLFSCLSLDLVEAAAVTCTLAAEPDANSPLPSEGWGLSMCWNRPADRFCWGSGDTLCHGMGDAAG